MKRILAAAAVLAAACAPTAGAKEISRVELCGAGGCHAIAIPEGLHEWPGGGGGATGPPAAAPFVELRISIDRARTETLWYVPEARMFASERDQSVWWSPVSSQRIDRIIVRAARRIEPYRARVVAASVDGVRVEGDVSGYIDLFRVGKAAADPGPGFVRVTLQTKPDSPWAATALWLYPDEGVLQRGGNHVELPADIARDLSAARPLGGAQSSSGFAWPLVSGWLFVAAAFVAGAALLARRSLREAA